MNAGKEEDPNFQKILALLLKTKGFDGHQYKPNYIKRRVAVRMRAMETKTYLDYLRVLQNNRQEPALLLDRLTIHVTEFFRDPNVYQAIKQNILPGFPVNPGIKLKIWCAGCSTGEEPYSVAMILKECSFSQPGFDFEIFATDIDMASIRTAEKGEYPVEALKKLSKAQVTRWFYVEGSRARVVADLKKHVHFRAHDLLSEWVDELSGFQLIFCRNLLIYLTAPLQQKIYKNFAGALAAGGFLILGLTETLLGPSRKFYECVDVRNRIYRLLEKTENFWETNKEEKVSDG